MINTILTGALTLSVLSSPVVPINKPAQFTKPVFAQKDILAVVEENKAKKQTEAKTASKVVYIYTAPTSVASATAATTPAPSAIPASYAGGPLNEAQITFLGTCESGMTATRNSGNGYYGAFQFSIGTWNSMGTGYERADMAPLEVQKDAVQRLLSRSSIFTQFPGCARKMSALGLI